MQDSDGEQPIAISHDMLIFKDRTWVLHVHGHQVDSTICPGLVSIPFILNPESFVTFLKLIDKLNVCVGQPDSRFVDMMQQKNNEIISPVGNKTAYIDKFAPVYCNEQKYAVTVRTANCEVLTSETKCKHCKAYRVTLRTLSNRLTKSVVDSNASSNNHTNKRYVHQYHHYVLCIYVIL